MAASLTFASESDILLPARVGHGPWHPRQAGVESGQSSVDLGTTALSRDLPVGVDQLKTFRGVDVSVGFWQEAPLDTLQANDSKVPHHVLIKQCWHSCIQSRLKQAMAPDPQKKDSDLFLRRRVSRMELIMLLRAVRQQH
ncbi:hypothetical protein NZL82_13025 [Sphingomonas sanguinis]|nr:hypothetical protein [Sphingomonas sp. LC-1]